MDETSFREHQAFEVFDQVRARISDDEVTQKVDIDSLNLFNSVCDYLSDRLKLSIPVLVPDTQLNNLAQNLSKALTEINTFIGNNNAGHLKNAAAHFNNVLNVAKNLPLPYSQGDFNYSKSIENFESILKKKLEELTKLNNELENKLDHFDQTLFEKNKNITELGNLIKQKENEIQNLNNTFQTEFNNIKASATQQYELDRKQFRAETDEDRNTFQNLMKEFKTIVDNEKKTFIDERKGFKESIEEDRVAIKNNTDEIIKKLESKLEEAKKLVNVIGNVGVTGNYRLIADNHEKAANIWRYVAIFFMLVLSTLLIYSIWDLSGVDYDWSKSLLRILAAAALSYPATYAARESNKHRKFENYNRKAELELASINPFIELLDEGKKQEIIEKLASKYFGNNDGFPNSDEKEADPALPVSSVEKLLKVLASIIKK